MKASDRDDTATEIAVQGVEKTYTIGVALSHPSEVSEKTSIAGCGSWSKHEQS